MMADDPIRALVDKLESIEAAVNTLSAELNATPIGQSAPRAGEIEEAIERGTRKAARDLIRPVEALHTMARDLERAASGLIAATEPAKRAVQAQEGASRVKIAAIVLFALLSVSMAFLGGVYTTRSGLLLKTEAGCTYLGGTWSKKQNEPGYVCWR